MSLREPAEDSLISKQDIFTVPRADYRRWCESRLGMSSSAANDIAVKSENAADNHIQLDKQRGSPFGYALPPELLLEILNYVKSSQATLYAVSLVCRQWHRCAAPLLYRRIEIDDTYRWATFILTLTRKRKLFEYGSMVQIVDLAGGKSLEYVDERETARRRSSVTATTTITRMNDGITISTTGNITDADFFAREAQESIVVSTSSLSQLSHTCKNLTSLNLSFTTLLYDSIIAETGEYLSTLQHYAVQPGLTQIQIPIQTVIESLGRECPHLREVKLQRCEWVTAHVIWLWVTHCPSLVRLDARRSCKCTVKRLIISVLEAPQDSTTAIGRDDENSSHSNSDAELRSWSSTSTQTERGGHLIEGSDYLLDDEDDDEDIDMHPIRRYLLDQVSYPTTVDVFQNEYALETATAAGSRHPLTPFLQHAQQHVQQETMQRPIRRRRRMGPLAPAQVQQPLPSPTNANQAPTYAESFLSIAIHNPPARTLRDVVYDILRDAKEMGSLELSWFQG